jgi:hypothetical protein
MSTLATKNFCCSLMYGHDHALEVEPGVARILLPVLDESRRRELLELREDVLGERLDVLLLEDDRNGDHHREVRGRPLVVVGHAQHGARAVAHERDHGGIRVKRCVARRHVEPAKGLRGPRRDREAERGRQTDQTEERERSQPA